MSHSWVMSDLLRSPSVWWHWRAVRPCPPWPHGCSWNASSHGEWRPSPFVFSWLCTCWAVVCLSLSLLLRTELSPFNLLIMFGSTSIWADWRCGLLAVPADEDWTSKVPIHHCKLGCCLSQSESGPGLRALNDEYSPVISLSCLSWWHSCSWSAWSWNWNLTLNWIIWENHEYNWL